MPPKKWFILSKKTIRRFSLLIRKLKPVFLLFVSVSFFIFLGKSQWLKVKRLDCRQGDFPCNQTIVNIFEEVKGKNIFLVNFDNLSQKVKDINPIIKKIELTKKLPDKVLIKIYPRQPVAALTVDNKIWFLIDEQNFIYKKVFEKPSSIPIIIVGNKYFLYLKQKINEEKIIKATLFLKKLKENFINFNLIVLSKGQTINVFLENSIVASFSAEKKIEKQVDSLQFILRQSKIKGKLPAFIDVRFNKPIIKY